MKKLLLAGVAALFLATGTAHAQELDIHSGENLVMLLLEKVDGEKHMVALNTQENCFTVLEVIEARTKVNKETWLTLRGQEKPERVLNVICTGTPSNQCPPNIAGKTPKDGKAC
jgi:hypothetical protein